MSDWESISYIFIIFRDFGDGSVDLENKAMGRSN